MWIFREPLIQHCSKGSLKKCQGIKWKDFHGLKINQKGKQRPNYELPLQKHGSMFHLSRPYKQKLNQQDLCCWESSLAEWSKKQCSPAWRPGKRRMWVSRSPLVLLERCTHTCKLQHCTTGAMECSLAGDMQKIHQIERCVFCGLSLTVTQNIFRERPWEEICLFCIWSVILFVFYSPSNV